MLCCQAVPELLGPHHDVVRIHAEYFLHAKGPQPHQHAPQHAAVNLHGIRSGVYASAGSAVCVCVCAGECLGVSDMPQDCNPALGQFMLAS